MTTVNKAENRINRIFQCITARLRGMDRTPILLVWAVAVMYCLLCPLIGRTISGRSGYFTYTLQALAWRDGRVFLEKNYEWLELANYQGHWYVSFPPVPSIPLFFLTFIFQDITPDNLLVKLYVLFGCLAVYRMLLRAGYSKLHALCFSLLCSYASCIYVLTNEGAVWYQAQTLAFCLTCISLHCMWIGRPATSLVCYALAVGCRPFNAVYGIILFALYGWQQHTREKTFKEAFIHLLPGLIGGFLIACAYGWYNYIRFDNPFEFGHSYLPEFSWQGGTQFSIAHIPQNIRTFVFGLPFGETMNGWELNKFGFSFLAANPVFILMLFWIICDLVRRRFTWLKGCILLCFLAQLFLLLLHRTFGGYQFGARYTCDLLPYAALYLALPGRKRKMHTLEAMVLITSMGFSIYGFINVIL